MKRAFFLLAILISVASFGQKAKVNLNPTVSPVLFMYNDQITVTYDVTGTSLANLSQAWAWVWIPGNQSITAKYNINPATAAADPAKFTKSVEDGKTLFRLTFVPQDFFVQSIEGQTEMGILLKGNDWQTCPTASCQTTDSNPFLMFWDGSFQVVITSPSSDPVFVKNGEVINIEASSPLTADFELYLNDDIAPTDTKSGIKDYSYSHTVSETSGSTTVRIVATAGANDTEDSFTYIISESPAVARPAGIIPGINYDDADPTRVTLCLRAPTKDFAFVRGDFNDWGIESDFIMNRDGEYFWIEINNLVSGQEYAFQYVLDGAIICDPYADKILDYYNDQYIPSATYPGLKTFPQNAVSSQWEFNFVSVFQTNQQPYDWVVTNFTKPEKKNLIIYELLIRDFFADGQRNYQNLIDTIGYFKRLGINTIELMPITEFSGNDSWGYNPNFMFAPDKYYGTKNKLKEFIDVCHQNGIAVILDMVMNQQEKPNAYLLMDFDFAGNVPTPENKYFNQQATHPFSVFYDINHESTYTQDYLDTINYYWLNEYKFDGFRFDLSKGFTQKVNSDVGAWSSYDASRIAILKRMADKIWSHSPGAYVILEHFAANTEEKELAQYRAGEGKGMMLWGNLHYAYNQSTMGYGADSDISGVSHLTRGWSFPHLIGYMESHDEERMVYNNFQYGNSASGHNTSNLTVALYRMRGAATTFYTIPGPKMLWQFGELGYDYSINYCIQNGTIDNGCRVGAKPVKWEYLDEPARKRLFEHVSDLLRLRTTYPVFRNGSATITGGSTLLKQISIKGNPYVAAPSNTDQMNVVIAANFDVYSTNASVSFPHAGTWYDYYLHGTEVEVSGTSKQIQLSPGEFKLFTDVVIGNPLVTDVEAGPEQVLSVFPNPVGHVLNIDSDLIKEVCLLTVQGARICPPRVSNNTWNTTSVKPGVYVAEIRKFDSTISYIKILKE